MSDGDDIVFEDVPSAPGMPRRRIGKSAVSGVVLIESRFDQEDREIEKCFYKDDGEPSKRIVYEYDEDRRPRLTSVFDREGKLIWRHERGKRPETLG